MAGVAGDGLGEPRDQVMAKPQRDIDLRPRALTGKPQLDEPVVRERDPKRDQRERGDGDDQPD